MSDDESGIITFKNPSGGRMLVKRSKKQPKILFWKNETDNSDSKENLEIELFSKKGVEFSKVLSKRVDQVKRLLEMVVK